jgi:hypothetical protein
METPSHATLKRLAVQFLLWQGCRAVAKEVRCPGSKYVLDAAGYLDPRPRRERGRVMPAGPGPSGPVASRDAVPRTIIVECKQSRADFIRDSRRAERLLAERGRLEAERARIEEERIKVHEPELRRSGGSLFPELETWDFAGSRLATYRRVLAALRRVDQRLYGQTKLWIIAQRRLADRMYIAAPAGMIAPRELPRGWGLLEAGREEMVRAGAGRVNGRRGGEPPGLRLAAAGEDGDAREQHRHRLLRNIAVAATRDSLAAARGTLWSLEAGPVR